MKVRELQKELERYIQLYSAEDDVVILIHKMAQPIDRDNANNNAYLATSASGSCFLGVEAIKANLCSGQYSYPTFGIWGNTYPLKEKLDAIRQSSNPKIEVSNVNNG